MEFFQFSCCQAQQIQLDFKRQMIFADTEQKESAKSLTEPAW